MKTHTPRNKYKLIVISNANVIVAIDSNITNQSSSTLNNKIVRYCTAHHETNLPRL